MPCRKPEKIGFTLVELLVVIGVVAVLLAILIPALSRVRQTSRSTTCQSNLRTLAASMSMYCLDNVQAFPFPTTTFGETVLWFNAVDKYLAAKQGREGATGVALTRSYKRFKQCPSWMNFGDAKRDGAQDPIVEAARFFKMNLLLRRNNHPPRVVVSGGSVTRLDHARVPEVKEAARHVMIGDGVSLDMVPNVVDQYESNSFAMEVNEDSESGPGLRHFGGANILFVDGHVELVNNLPTIKDPLRNPHAGVSVKNWEGEYRQTSSTGALVNPAERETRTMVELGLIRNPSMPLIWSELGRLYR